MGLFDDYKNANGESSVKKLINIEWVLKKLDGALSDFTTLKQVYPVGSIFMTVSNVNPSTWITGTTWAAWGSGRVPVGVDTSQTEFNSSEKTGGAKTATNDSSGGGTSGGTAITEAQMPSHNHSQSGTHTVSATIGNQSAKHRHKWYGDVTQGGAADTAYNAGNNGVSKFRGYDTDEETANHTHSFSGSVALSGNTGSKGSGTAHTHTTPNHQHTVSTLQPYITCYMWKRIT